MNKQDCKEEGLALSDDDDHDLIMSSSAKEIVGAIAECRWDLMSLDEKKKHIKAYNQNIPNVEFFDALNDNELNEVMSDFRHHTGIDSGINETYVTTTFLKFSNRKYENKYRAFASQIALSSDEETFTIELNLKPVGGTFYTIKPNERDRYEANINNLDKPISILVSSSDGKYRTVSVAVGDRVRSFTLEDNEYMGGFISEVIEFMSDGIIGKPLTKKKSKKEQDGKSEEHGNNKQEIKKNETSDLKKSHASSTLCQGVH